MVTKHLPPLLILFAHSVQPAGAHGTPNDGKLYIYLPLFRRPTTNYTKLVGAG